MMGTVFDVARYILEHTGAISTWKLQKLCYYAQAWSLAWTGSPLFNEDFEAWRNGPVCPELFHRHKGMFKADASIVSDANVNALTDDERDTIDTVLRDYGDMEPHELRAQSHVEAPWKDARGGIDSMASCNTVITKDAMGEYYGSL